MSKNLKTLIISIAITLGTGILSGILTSNSMETYRNMYKPPLSPPGWVFPIVWTVLFILMGISLYLVYTSPNRKDNCPLVLFAAQLIVNFIWPILFFRLEAYLLAFAWLLLLWYLVWLTYKKFKSINPLAGNLLLPYLIWITFAGYLNLAIVIEHFFH